MARILRRRPSPAMVIALIALFVAMGGVSYGVATGSIDSREIKNNTVKSGDLRNNDIRGKDIRSSTIGGSDVASNTLKGADIDESSLGKVPSATNADKATTADRVDTIVTVDRFTLTNGQTRTIATRGPLSLVAECAINNPANNDSAVVRAVTTADNSTLDASDETEDVDPGTPAADREYSRATSTPTGTPEVEANSSGTFLAANGQYISNAGFLVGVNLPGSGNSTCTFAGKLLLG